MMLMIEALESRQFLSASLKVENLDVIPGFERLIFNRIRTPNEDIPNYVKDRGTLRLSNIGDQTLRFSSIKINGPFRILGLPPEAIPVGKSVNLTVQFTATTAPPFTYNQTAGFDNQTRGGTHTGSLVFTTNDPANATYSEALAGWWQSESEKNMEPNLQTIVNLISDFKTDLAPPRTTQLTQPADDARYYGEEVISAYWQVANPSRPVGVRHIATFHTQGEPVFVGWFPKGGGNRNILVTDGATGQSFLPYKNGQKGVPAQASFSPGTATFGFKIDTEWSDDKLNTRQTGGGHHVRFYPVRDHFGNIIENSYFMAMDYSLVGAGTVQNYDFQDNIYIVNNVKPAGN
jgi:hypothetical protein